MRRAKERSERAKKRRMEWIFTEIEYDQENLEKDKERKQKQPSPCV
jgi:hypothetical protein